ncbi:MAG: hypothetical protein KIS78_07850, partial [Labilithrix sp.]|nr:hypothetical protein [Labilithrix sp.]
MAASPSPSARAPAHAGVALDLTAIEPGSARVAHDHAPVEPIPWKTGDVGVVPPLDLDTSFRLAASGLGPLRSPERI